MKTNWLLLHITNHLQSSHSFVRNRTAAFITSIDRIEVNIMSLAKFYPTNFLVVKGNVFYPGECKNLVIITQQPMQMLQNSDRKICFHIIVSFALLLILSIHMYSIVCLIELMMMMTKVQSICATSMQGYLRLLSIDHWLVNKL